MKSNISRYQDIWPQKTILDYLQESVAKFPHKLAIIDKKSRFTYAELDTLVTRVALGLYHYGLREKDVVSIQLPNWNEFVILHLAITKLGAITNPLVPIYRENEVSYMIQETNAKMYIIPDTFRKFNYVEMYYRIQAKIPSVEQVFVAGEHVKGLQSLSELFNTDWENRVNLDIFQMIKLDPNDITEIIFTSGTTGHPKGVLHTHNTLCVSANFWVNHLKLQSNDVLFMASTFAHQTGFGYGMRLPLHYGGTAVYQDIWDPEEFATLIEKEGITYTAGATPFLHDFLYTPALESSNISSLHTFLALGAPIPRSLLENAKKRVAFSILSGWGQTENGLVTLTKTNDSDEKLLKTDGAPFPSMHVQIVDEQMNPVPPNVEGLLLCKGPSLFIGYLNNEKQTAKEFYEDWFITGDLAIMDEDGYIRISGRKKDIIIRGGENIPVSYVENILYKHPAIKEIQIVAKPCPRLQERACACVVLNDNYSSLNLENLVAFLQRQGVAKQYWPEFIEIFDEFPVTPSGKTQKFKLRELIL